jgi:hypothetical protein
LILIRVKLKNARIQIRIYMKTLLPRARDGGAFGPLGGPDLQAGPLAIQIGGTARRSSRVGGLGVHGIHGDLVQAT